MDDENSSSSDIVREKNRKNLELDNHSVQNGQVAMNGGSNLNGSVIQETRNGDLIAPPPNRGNSITISC